MNFSIYVTRTLDSNNVTTHSVKQNQTILKCVTRTHQKKNHKKPETLKTTLMRLKYIL